MQTETKRIDSGVEVMIPEAIMRLAGLKVGDAVDFRARNGAILIQPAAKRRRRLDELRGAYKPVHRHELTDFGPDVGREIVE